MAMSKRTRREFLKTGAAAATGAVAGLTASAASQAESAAKPTMPPSVLGANERLSIGYIGVGSWARYAHLKHIVEYGGDWNASGAAVCDPWSKNRDRGLEMLGLGPQDGYQDYRRLLDRNDIDAVVVASVTHNHGPIGVDALDAGKHVYLEKPMTRYLGEAFEVHDAVLRTGRTFQLGSQFTTDAKWHKAAELVRSGAIGAPVLAQDSWVRNKPEGEWNVDIDPECTAETVDWRMWLGRVSDRPFSPDAFFRWKKYYPFCSGILGNLLSHRIASIMVASRNPEFPTRVACLGNHKVTPDRDITDQTQVIAEFPSGLNVILLGSTVNEQGLEPMFRGHKGTVYFEEGALEMRPERPFGSLADSERFEDLQPGASVPHHMANFFDAIRTGIQPNGNIDLALKTQTVISLAEMSERLGEMMHFDAESRVITNGSGRVYEPITYGTLD